MTGGESTFAAAGITSSAARSPFPRPREAAIGFMHPRCCELGVLPLLEKGRGGVGITPFQRLFDDPHPPAFALRAAAGDLPFSRGGDGAWVEGGVMTAALMLPHNV
jgi:hypothetical protein